MANKLNRLISFTDYELQNMLPSMDEFTRMAIQEVLCLRKEIKNLIKREENGKN